jgi:biopolymer transport protein ExbB/biopolymer transport protein TolQ
MTRRDVEALPPAVQAAARASARVAALVHEDLKQGLSSLATIAYIAPLVGLFGTVIGILFYTFLGICGDKTSAMAALAERISQDCLLTALGLLVAVPALCAYKYFSARLQTFDHEMQIASSQLVSQLMTMNTTR